ncbi:MAG: inositol monophosphatase family protein, partial [Planctomycetota bacterium]
GLDESLLATGFSYERRELDHGALEVFESLLKKAREIRRGGSACLDMAHTASGVFQGFWEFHLAPHDVAAGALLVREAGGIVTDSTGGDNWLNGGSIVAASVDLHPLLLEVVSRATPPADGAPLVGDR